jgi:hypothetical protein
MTTSPSYMLHMQFTGEVSRSCRLVEVVVHGISKYSWRGQYASWECGYVMAYKVVCAPAHPPARPIDLCACPTKKYSSIFKYIQAYSSIFEYIQAYSSIFEVFLNNIQKICPIRLVHAWHNGQDRLPARLLCPPAMSTR